MTIKIYFDEFAESPREWSPLGTLVCSHRKYDLSDVPFPQAGEHGSLLADFKEYLKTISLTLNDIIYTPVYMYDHSGIALSSTPFSCKWDSGLLGYHYVSKSTIHTEYSVKRISPKLHKSIISVLDAELEVYNHYVQGNCYEFRIFDSEDEFVDSCGGFIGDLDDVKQQMYEHVDSTLWKQLNNIDYSDIVY